jgi:hypothetical protein
MPKFFVAFYATIFVIGALAVVGIYGTDAGRAANSELGMSILNGVPATNYTGS